MSDMGVFHASIYHSSIGKLSGFIYGVYSPQFNCVYIGETVKRHGALARLAEHLSSDEDFNTLQKKICKYKGFEEVNLEQIEFAAVPLSRRPEFTGYARDYREAVETLVQSRIRRFIIEHKLQIAVVSSVMDNDYRKLDFVRMEADNVTQHLSRWLIGARSSHDLMRWRFNEF